MPGKLAASLTALFLLMAGAGTAGAQDYPVRPVRLVVPFAPGGGTDILGRLLAQKLGESLGQPVIVENRPGAGGNLGTEAVAKAAPDGYTLLMVSASFAVNAAAHALNYDPTVDLAPVAQIALVPFVLVAHPSLAADSVQELIALAKAKPGSLTYASSGNGSSPHLAGELLGMMTGTRMVHVPYKGGLPALNDVIGGQVQLLFSTVVQGLPMIKAGRLKPLAVASLRRSGALPQLATLDESGVAGFDVSNWFGILAPGRTSPALIARLNVEIVRHLQSPDFKARLADEGAEPESGSPEQFRALIARDIEKFRRIVTQARVSVQ